MAVTMKDFGIDILSVDDRLTLVQEIWDSISACSDLPPVSEAQRRLIDQRVEELNADPNNVVTWAEIKRQVLEKR